MSARSSGGVAELYAATACPRSAQERRELRRAGDGQGVDQPGPGQVGAGEGVGDPGVGGGDVGGRDHRQREARRGRATRAGSACPCPSWAATSAVTRSLAVAVVASTGRAAGQAGEHVLDPAVVGAEVRCPSPTRSAPRRRRACPMREARCGSTRERKPKEFSRSGEMSRTSTSSAAIRASMAGQSSMLALFSVTARSPDRSAAATWSRIRASSGEMTSVGPEALRAAQPGGDPVHRRLAPAGALDDDDGAVLRRPAPRSRAHWSSRSAAPRARRGG